jgi:hypothetical protein
MTTQGAEMVCNLTPRVGNILLVPVTAPGTSLEEPDTLLYVAVADSHQWAALATGR